jgi:hypothetical protein
MPYLRESSRFFHHSTTMASTVFRDFDGLSSASSRVSHLQADNDFSA